MNLRELEYMTTIEKVGSVSKAAERLHISQPSLSQFVQKVERNVGYKIFDRSSKMFSLTASGEEYIKTCHEILQLHKELEKRVEEISETKRGRVVIGVSSHRSPYLLPNILPPFLQRYPGINVEVIERLSTDELEELALRGEIDLFFTTAPLKNNGFSTEFLSDDIVSLVLPPGSAIRQATEEFTFDSLVEYIRTELCDMKFVLSPQTMKLGRLIDKFFKRINFEPLVFFETYNMDTGVNLARKGLCASFTFSTLIPLKSYDPFPVFIPIKSKDFTVTFALAFPKQHYLSKAAQAFIGQAKEECVKESL